MTRSSVLVLLLLCVLPLETARAQSFADSLTAVQAALRLYRGGKISADADPLVLRASKYGLRLDSAVLRGARSDLTRVSWDTIARLPGVPRLQLQNIWLSRNSRVDSAIVSIEIDRCNAVTSNFYVNRLSYPLTRDTSSRGINDEWHSAGAPRLNAVDGFCNTAPPKRLLLSPVPAWAFPMLPAGAPQPPFDSTTPLSVPGSRAHYTQSQILGAFVVADWHPEIHPQMPDVVSRGRPPAQLGCAYCHLPTGLGRPENANIAGLNADYIVQQVADMKSGARKAAWDKPSPWGASMWKIAASATDAEVAEAAAYFSKLKPRPHVTVVESDRVPVTRIAGSLYAVVPNGGTEPLGVRLIEVARDHDLHERHDDLLGYIAYVPRGSITRGRQLARQGIAGANTACTTCHGADLRGVGKVPAIAGRSPSYLLRQLLAIQTGARDTPASVPMRNVVARLTIDDMIAAVAYAASRTP